MMLQEWHYYFQNTLRWRNLRKITVAQVQGTVYAAGLMLMWACDLIVAADNVFFADVVGTRLGMCGVEYFGHPWEFGPRKAKELMLTGDAIDVHEAHRLGMVSKMFPVDELEEQTLAFARRIAELPTMTALLIKESVNQTVDNMGFYNSLQACFTLHQLNHSHWAERPREQVPGGACPRTGSPTGATPRRCAWPFPTPSRARPPAAEVGGLRGGTCTSRTSLRLGPDHPAVVMGGPGRRVTYRELDDRSLRFARALVELGLRRGDHYAVVMENHPAYYEVVWAGLRSGLYVTAVNSHLTAGEAGYIVDDCGAEVVVTSGGLADLAEGMVGAHARGAPPPVGRRQAAGRPRLLRGRWWRPTSPSSPGGEQRGMVMLYSSGTTGRPKGIEFPLPAADSPLGEWEIAEHSRARYGYGEDMVYLGPAPLYHAAPLRVSLAVQCVGGTVVVMERFDPAGRAGAHRARAGHPLPVGAHDVRPHAEASRGGALRLRPVQPPAGGARGGPVPGGGQGADDRVVGTDHGGVLRRHRAHREHLDHLARSGWTTRARWVGRATGAVVHICDDDGQRAAGGRDRDRLLRGHLRHLRVPRRPGEDREPRGTRSIPGGGPSATWAGWTTTGTST